MIPVAPGLFATAGAGPEKARAEALQADRAAVLRGLGPAFVPRRWYTHGELPPNPHPPGLIVWNPGPWSTPATPIEQTAQLDTFRPELLRGTLYANPTTPPRFGEPLTARAWRALALRWLFERWSLADRFPA